MEEQCYALLIDADNVSAKYIKPILTELSKYGIITYKRIYGDWTSTQHSSWKDELLTIQSRRSSSLAIHRGRTQLIRL